MNLPFGKKVVTGAAILREGATLLGVAAVEVSEAGLIQRSFIGAVAPLLCGETLKAAAEGERILLPLAVAKSAKVLRRGFRWWCYGSKTTFVTEDDPTFRFFRGCGLEAVNIRDREPSEYAKSTIGYSTYQWLATDELYTNAFGAFGVSVREAIRAAYKGLIIPLGLPRP